MKRILFSGGALLLGAFASCVPYLSLDEALKGTVCPCAPNFTCVEEKCVPDLASDTRPIRPPPDAGVGPIGAGNGSRSGGAAGASAEPAGSAGTGSTDPGGAAGTTPGNVGGAPGSGGTGTAGADGAPIEPIPGGADAGCERVILYRDRDGDGFGSTALEDLREGCPPFDGYSTRSGDCHDAVPSENDPAGDVFPGQPRFFSLPYPTAANGLSFDYDCSEREDVDPNPAFVQAPTNCAERPAPLCGADSGYLPDARTGTGVNPLCGARERASCFGAAECVLSPLQAGERVPCH